MKLSKAETERRYFERFSKFYPLPDGLIEYGDKPDVIVRGRNNIGIEITNFFLRSGALAESEQQQRPLWAKIVKDAYLLYRESGNQIVEILIGFDKATTITPARRIALPKELASFIRTLDGRASGSIEPHLFQALMPEISWIYLHSGEFSSTGWSVMQVDEPALFSSEGLTSIVRGKEVKAADYRTCDTLWLLVVIDAMDPAQEQEVRVDDLRVSSNVFEKVILFHTFGRIVEVNVRCANRVWSSSAST